MIQEDFEIRIGTCGQVDTGKSTLLGILTNPKNNSSITELDDGRGLARKRIFKHQHEKETGRTSSITYCYTKMNSKGYTFIDLAGHEKYLSTTMTGISGGVLDYIIVLLGANTGTVPRITKEHISLALAYRIPIIFVITKIDMNVEQQKTQTISKIKNIMESKGAGNKKIKEINNKNGIEECLSLMKENSQICPLFQVSNTTGENIDLLVNFISKLDPRISWQKKIDKDPLFLIEEVFHITGIGIVVSGTMKKGFIKTNQNLLLGPMNGQYKNILIKSIHNNDREFVKELKAGQTGCFWIKPVNYKDKINRKQIKRSMVIMKDKKCTYEFNANITILHNPSTIKINYQPVIHCGNIKQAAKVCEITDNETNQQKEILRSGDKATIKFKFMFHPEFVEDNSLLVFREGKTKGVGRITSF
jgi:small GTP-binding protein